MKIAVLDVHSVCNQHCSYCVSRSSPANDFGPITQTSVQSKIVSFFKTHGPFNILFTGGEPLITPGIGELFQRLHEEGQKISLQTNLRTGSDIICRYMDPARTGWILATLHSEALPELEDFVTRASNLRRRGYPIVIKLVLDDKILRRVREVASAFRAIDIGVILSPLVYFPTPSKAVVKRYTSEEWEYIAPLITLKSSWLYFAGGWRSQKSICSAGSRLINVRAIDGIIHGCCHGYPQAIGHLYEDRLEKQSEAVLCDLTECVCDFHYYSGIIHAVNDRSAFYSLASGENQTISYDGYNQWITEKRIHPIYDLIRDIVRHKWELNWSRIISRKNEEL